MDRREFSVRLVAAATPLLVRIRNAAASEYLRPPADPVKVAAKVHAVREVLAESMAWPEEADDDLFLRPFASWLSPQGGSGRWHPNARRKSKIYFA